MTSFRSFYLVDFPSDDSLGQTSAATTKKRRKQVTFADAITAVITNVVRKSPSSRHFQSNSVRRARQDWSAGGGGGGSLDVAEGVDSRSFSRQDSIASVLNRSNKIQRTMSLKGTRFMDIVQANLVATIKHRRILRQVRWRVYLMTRQPVVMNYSLNK